MPPGKQRGNIGVKGAGTKFPHLHMLRVKVDVLLLEGSCLLFSFVMSGFVVCCCFLSFFNYCLLSLSFYLLV